MSTARSSTGRVLHLLGPSTGGIGRHVSYLAQHLRAGGWDVDVAGPVGVVEGVQPVPVPTGIDPRGVQAARRALRPLLEGMDIVHAHGLKAGWIASTVKPRPPLVVSVHNVVLDEAAGRAAPLLRLLERRLPRRAALTIAVSRQIAEQLADVPGADRIHVVPPAGPPPMPDRTPAEVRAELGVASGDDLVVTAARLHPQKGLDDLLAAAAIVVAERPRLRWFVFGHGPLHDQLERSAARSGLGDVVHFAGARPSVDSELAAADAVVVTSRWESGPLVVLEALALGRPVVSTRVGLAADVVHEPMGRLVEVGDPTGLAAAVVDVLADPPDGLESVGGSLRHFEAPALASRVEDLYRKVIGST